MNPHSNDQPPSDPRSREQEHYEQAPSAIIIKFQDSFLEAVHATHDAEGAARIAGALGRAWSGPETSHIRFSLEPLFAQSGEAGIDEIVEKARQRDKTYDPPNLLGYYELDLPDSADRVGIAARLSRPDLAFAIEEAYPVPRISLPRTNDPDLGLESFLTPAPLGIDAFYAWNFGRGENQRLIDLEGGWEITHEDLPTNRITLRHGLNMPGFDTEHGTQVLGVICAVDDNSLGIAGIAPGVSAVDLVSWWRPNGKYSTARALKSIASKTAAGKFDVGDVLLIEAQEDVLDYDGLTHRRMPLETDPLSFDLIRLITALGLVVVEAAGNGPNDLDAFRAKSGKYVLRRNAPRRDSRAILVGGGRWDGTSLYNVPSGLNQGGRIDCFAQASAVQTTRSDATFHYTGSFGATSSASAIIAGAALLVQGIAQARRGQRYDSAAMRAVLGDANAGHSTAATIPNRIGVMPNLAWIIDNVLVPTAPQSVAVSRRRTPRAARTPGKEVPGRRPPGPNPDR